MKKTSIRKHLVAYSIKGKRETTIRHAFASALAPIDEYDEELVNQLLISLEQDINSDIKCAYCNEFAETWDHVNGLVKDKSSSGHGHTYDNLLPSCKTCNSSKGNRSLEEFFAMKFPNKKEIFLEKFTKHFSKMKSLKNKRLESLKNEKNIQYLKELRIIEEEIICKMAEADLLVKKIKENNI